MKAEVIMDPTIRINDLFWTFQGEGRFSGHRALFVRLPFCNYDCPWCDTEFNSFKKWDLESFQKFITQENCRFAVITGGEPLASKELSKVLKVLKDLGFFIASETNGSFPAPKEIDFVTTSPKKYTKGNYEPYYVHPDLWERTAEWKYVVDSEFDFDLLERHEENKGSSIYSLSPEFTHMDANLKRIQNYIRHNPKWKISLQTHKWIGIP